MSGPIDKINKTLRDAALTQSFEDVQEVKLSKMSAKELAAWQFSQPANSPHQILASHEWQCRLLARQVRWMRFSVIATALATVIAALLGAIVGAVMSYTLPKIFEPHPVGAHVGAHEGEQRETGAGHTKNEVHEHPEPTVVIDPLSPPEP